MLLLNVMHADGGGWYGGTISGFDPTTRQHLVHYEDSDTTQNTCFQVDYTPAHLRQVILALLCAAVCCGIPCCVAVHWIALGV